MLRQRRRNNRFYYGEKRNQAKERRKLFSLRWATDVLRKALTAKLKDQTIEGIYADRGIGLAIPAVEMSQHRSWVFKTPHLKDTTSHRDDNYKLVDVCLATTAAPVYRSMAAVDHPDNMNGGYNVFVDGGLCSLLHQHQNAPVIG